MIISFKARTLIIIVIVLGLVLGGLVASMRFVSRMLPEGCTEPGHIEVPPAAEPSPKDYIRWAQFDVSYNLLLKAYNLDVNSAGVYNWVEILSYSVAKNYGNVGSFSDNKRVTRNMDECVKMLKDGKRIEEIAGGLKHYGFYFEVYQSILGGFLKEGKLPMLPCTPDNMRYCTLPQMYCHGFGSHQAQ